MIHTGTINDENKRMHLDLVKFESSDFHNVKKFILKEYVNIRQKDFFILEDIDTVLPLLLQNKGLVYGAVHDNQIVAIQAIDLSIENSNSLKLLLSKYVPADKYVEMGWTITNRCYRHKGIASSIVRVVEDIVSTKLADPIFVATVHPQNINALKVYLHLNYYGVILKYHFGVPRIFLLKGNNQNLIFDNKNKAEVSTPNKINEAFDKGYMLFDIVNRCEQCVYIFFKK